MRFTKHLILPILLFLFLFPHTGFAANSVSVQLGASLPAVLTLDGFVVNGVEYPSGGTVPIIVESKTVVNPALYVLGLTPVKVKVRSNTTAFLLSGQFYSLSKVDYSFPSAALSMDPASQTVINPNHPVHTSDDFTPSVQVTPSAKAGEYVGILIFTVNSL